MQDLLFENTQTHLDLTLTKRTLKSIERRFKVNVKVSQ